MVATSAQSNTIVGISARIFKYLPELLTAAALCVFSVLLASGWAWTNDGWFLLAIGEHVLQHGPAHDAWFSPFGGSTVEQQWLYTAVFALLYRAFGCIGPCCLAAIFFLVSYVLAALLVRRMTTQRPSPIRLALFLAACVLLSEGGGGVMGIRPSSASVVFWLISAHLGLSASRSNSSQYLYAVLFGALVAFHVNIHASMIFFDFIVFTAFFLNESLPAHGLWQSCRLLIVYLIAGVVGSLLNPYGWKGALYLPLSIISAKSIAVGTEMGSLLSKPLDVAIPFALICVFSFGISILWLWQERRFQATPILLILSAAMALIAVRCLNILALFLVLTSLLCPTLAFFKKNTLKQRRLLSLASGTLSILAGWFPAIFIVICLIWTAGDGFHFSAGAQLNTPATAVDSRAAIAEAGAQPGDSVLTDPLTAGALEYTGYRVAYDARPELYSPIFTGLDIDWNAEWCSFCYEGIDATNYIVHCNCDWIVLRTSSINMSFDKFQEAADKAGYRLLGVYDDTNGLYAGCAVFAKEAGASNVQ